MYEYPPRKPEGWFRRAEHDRAALSRLLAGPQVQWVAVVIFARQLAGKHLRAFLTSRGEVEGEDIHDLVTLLARCSKHDPSLVFMAEDCERLARWKPSYPDPIMPEPTESDARAALDVANRVCVSIRERVLLDGE